jgi:hypothetical protein
MHCVHELKYIDNIVCVSYHETPFLHCELILDDS